MAEHPPGASSDSVLRARMIAGDESALSAVITEHGPVVRGAARRILHDEATAADVVQELFVWLWEHPDRFDPERGSLRSFLAVAVRRRAIDRIRRDGSRRRALQRVALEDGGRVDGSATAQDPAEMIDEVETASRVRGAVAALPAAQRTAVELAYFGGCTYRVVATRLGIPEGTAKSRLRLGLARLADTLDPNGVDA